ncbi:MAG: flagellar hook-associated protein FlgK [FCB group bacterium]|nr:flagellar hook-associated protein FlgK [FCB group bacterium]
MGTLFSTLDIARSGLSAAQTQVDVAAHNIANVNTEGYSRQRAGLAARTPVEYPFGQMGRGVEITGIERLRDTFLDSVYRQQAPNLSAATTEVEYYNRIEDLFLEPNENGFSTRIGTFFDALSDFANNPESLPVREAVLAEADAIASSLKQVTSRLDDLRSHANAQIRELVPTINDISDRIADLNGSIAQMEAGGNAANDLRDERDRLLDQLSQYMDVTTQEHSNGLVDVFVGGEMLVNGVKSNHIAAVRTASLDPERDDLVSIQFASNNRPVKIESGELHALLNVRDTIVPQVDAQLDTIASALIQQINSIHSQGHGLQGLSGTVTSSFSVANTSMPMSLEGLPFDISTGSFEVVVRDSAGTASTSTIFVGILSSIDDVAASLNGVANLSAAVNADGQLEITGDAGYTFSFANDTSNVLVALGVNGFFSGTDARSIGVNQALRDNPSLITSAYATDIKETGDNTAALAMAGIRTARVLEDGSASINDYYESSIARLGVNTKSAIQTRDVEQGFVDNFQRRRLEVSGVSIDEEVTTMIQFQRAFEASSRVIGIVDNMLETLINAF